MRGEGFPVKLHLNHCRVNDIQYSDLARTLLAVYGPKISHMGLGHHTTKHVIDWTIIAIVLRICGIALSNQYSRPRLVVASVAIRMSDDRFADRLQREDLVDLLVKLGDEHAWRT